MEVFVEHLGGVQFEIKARQHTIVCDQPTDNGGEDGGMLQPELLMGSLGACAGFYAVEYLRIHKVEAGGTRVHVSADKVQPPARLDNFKITLTLPFEISEQHRKGVERAVHHCLIHNTLLHPPSITLDIQSQVSETATS